MEKLDMTRELRELYRPPAGGPVLVDVPPMSFLMVDGRGDPNTSKEYRAAIEALYALSYHLKFAVKRGPLALDYKVMPLEGLWWSDDVADFAAGRRERWQWTMMIAQPPEVTADLVEQARAEIARKKALPALARVRFESLDEGRCAQVLHVGPYSEESPTIEKLHAFVDEQGYTLRGRHHEIYLGDPRKAAPEKLKTVIRQPVAPRERPPGR